MWQVDPPEQSTLELGPTVMVQVDVPAHLRLHDEPHAPMQSVLFSQSSVQLVGPQLLLETSQVFPEGHVHVEPVQLGGDPLLPPQPANQSTTANPAMMKRMWLIVVPLGCHSHRRTSQNPCAIREHLHLLKHV